MMGDGHCGYIPSFKAPDFLVRRNQIWCYMLSTNKRLVLNIIWMSVEEFILCYHVMGMWQILGLCYYNLL